MTSRNTLRAMVQILPQDEASDEESVVAKAIELINPDAGNAFEKYRNDSLEKTAITLENVFEDFSHVAG